MISKITSSHPYARRENYGQLGIRQTESQHPISTESFESKLSVETLDVTTAMSVNNTVFFDGVISSLAEIY
jgi:hypothetical protein